MHSHAHSLTHRRTLPHALARRSLSGQLCRVSSLPGGVEEVAARMAALHVKMMASGDMGAALKFFFYALNGLGELCLVQLTLDKTSGSVDVAMKGPSAEASQEVAKAMAAALAPYQ